MQRRAGFTLIEMMISMAILLLLAGYLMQMLVNQSRAYAVVDRTTETQQNVRTVSSLLERELRTTGLLVPAHALVCGIDRTGGSDVLFVTDTAAIDDPDGSGDFLAVGVDEADYTGTGSSEDIDLAAMSLDGATYDTDGDGAADSDFLATTGPGPNRQGGVIIVDRNNPQRGTSCGVLESVSPGTSEIEVDFEVGGAVGESALVAYDAATMDTEELVAVPAHVYQVNGGTLERNGLALADDVEDLQVSYFFDTDGDLEEDAPGETPGADGAAQYDPSAVNHLTLREVRVFLVARTRAQNPNEMLDASQAQGAFQTTANRVDPGNPPDGFRRRVHSISVRPRNVGRRPPS